MSQVNVLDRDLPGTDSSRLEEIVEQFEQAWQRGSHPDLDSFRPFAGEHSRSVLVELVHVDLECRLKAGESARIEHYLERYPELADDPGTALDLLLSEYELRCRTEGQVPFAEFVRRSRPFRDALRQRRPGRAAAAPTPGGTAVTADDTDARAAAPSGRQSASPMTLPLTGASAEEHRPAPAANAPRRIGDYEILEVLGRGGMGVVYKARQVALKRLVALKMILGGAPDDPKVLERFRLEAEAAARLQHPNIVQIYEVGEHDGRPFFSLEFVEGGSLDRKLAAAPLANADAAALVETLARAVHVAHGHNIIHRDLKPANVLLAADGTPKITDFGLAKQLDGESGRTHSGAVLGTPSYMAPEQAEGRLPDIGPWTDVYALGAVLYEVLTGRPPFQGRSMYETLEQVRHQEPVAPRLLQPKVPVDLETICLKCLHKEPRRRYATALELAEDVRRFRAGEPIKARPVSARERAWKWARRRPAQAGLAAAVPLALVLGAAGAVGWGLYESQRALYESQRAVNEGQRAQNLEERLGRQQQKDTHWKRGQDHERAGRLADARDEYASALAILDAPGADAADRRRIAGDRDRVVGLLQTQAARRNFQDRRKTFDAHRAEVVFRQINLTDAAREANRAATRAEAEAALKAFDLSAHDAPAAAVRRLAAFGEQQAAEPAQLDEVAAGCCQVLLLWAEAEAPPGAADAAGARQALRLLDLAAALAEAHRLPTPRAWHVARARCLALAGDEAGAGAEAEHARGLKPDTALDLFLAARDHFAEGNLVGAAAACERTLRREPDHVAAQYLLAVCSMRTRHWAEAKAGFTACLGRRPDFVWARLLRATAQSLLDEFEPAEADFAEVLRQTDDPLARAVALVNRGAMWAKRHRPDAAVADLREAIRLQPDDPAGYLNLAEVYRDRREWDPAVAALDQALARRPDDALLYHTRARLQLQRGDRAAAAHDFEQAIAHAPAGAAAERLASDCVELAHLQHQAREYRAALASCNAALRAQPDYPPAYRQRADTLLAQEHYREAGEALDHYLLTSAGEPKLYRARGLIHAALRQYAEAVDAYGRALAQKPDADTLSYRGWAYLKLDAARPALADFEAALKLDPTQADALSGRGNARVRLGQVTAGLDDAEAALRHDRPTAEQYRAAACTYGRAVGQLEAQSGVRSVPVSKLYEYQERAAALLRAALEQVPPAWRADFWRAGVEAEPDLLPLHRSTALQVLARSYAH
jgi:tetratricopeptide (TPR) repeat protein